MAESPTKRSSFTLFEFGVILILATVLGGYVWHRARQARIRAVAGTLREAGARIKYGEDQTVRAVDMSSMPDDRIELNDLAALTELRALNLDHSETLDGHLKKLGEIRNLTSLHLVGTGVTDRGCREIARHSSLRFLDLRATFVSDVGLSQLKTLSGLRELRLAQTWISDKGLKQLTDMPALETLDLRHTDITDVGLTHLRNLKGLKLVRLSRSRVTKDGLDWLTENLPQLKFEYQLGRDFGHLRVRLKPVDRAEPAERENGFPQVDDLFVSERLIMKKLEHSHATRPRPADDTGLPSVPHEFDWMGFNGFTTYLNYQSAQAPSQLMTLLSKCRDLESLGLGGFRLEQDAFAEAHRLRFLRYVTIRNPVTDQHVADIARLPNLADLSLINLEIPHPLERFAQRHDERGVNTQMTDEALRGLSQCRSLSNLSIYNADISDKGLRYLTREKMPKLAMIRLRKIPGITKDGIFYLLREFPLLRNQSVWIQGDSRFVGWAHQFRSEEYPEILKQKKQNASN